MKALLPKTRSIIAGLFTQEQARHHLEIIRVHLLFPDGALVCNIGDMLDRLTGGWFKSTPHRVRNVSGHERLSFPLFFDPDLAARIEPLPRHAAIDKRLIDDDRTRRWDGASAHEFSGTYGEYLLAKVSKVFPQLRAQVM